jgi:predicted RNase H-like HicB family nuclease
MQLVRELAMRLTAIIEREGNGYVSLCPELDIASQGDTIEQARDNLQEALELFFECVSAEEVKSRLRSELYVTQVEVAVG